MKNNKVRVIIYIAVAIAVYILLSAVGLSILITSSMNTQQNEAFKAPIQVSSGADWGNEIAQLTGRNVGHLEIFDTDGNLLFNSFGSFKGSDSPLPDPMDTDYPCEQFLKKMKPGRIFRTYRFMNDSHQGILRVVYIFAVPIEYNGQTVGYVFNVHSPMYFSRTLMVFVLFFSAAYIVASGSVLLVLIMRRRYEYARQRYIDNVTHALKTPVTSIKALAETLYDGVESDPEEQRYDLELILQQAELQENMVRNILSLSRLQTGGMKPHLYDVRIEELINDPVKKHRPACEIRHIALTVSDNIPSMPQVRTDPEYIRQVIDVLLDNAVKFTPDGGEISVNACISGKKAVISIRDNGTGISKSDLNRIFDRFYTTSVGNAEGNGLGLAIARELIRSLGGRIWAESEPGEGTEVFFTVKLSK